MLDFLLANCAWDLFAEHAVVILKVVGICIPVPYCLVATAVHRLFCTKLAKRRASASQIDAGLKFIRTFICTTSWDSFDPVSSGLHTLVILADIFFLICERQGTIGVSNQFTDSQVKLAVLASAARLNKFDKN